MWIYPQLGSLYGRLTMNKLETAKPDNWGSIPCWGKGLFYVTSSRTLPRR